jgi:hypothetical protein
VDWPEWTGYKHATKADVLKMLEKVASIADTYSRYQWLLVKVMPSSLNNMIMGIHTKVKKGQEYAGYYSELKDVYDSLKAIDKLGPHPDSSTAAAAFGLLLVRVSKLVGHMPIPGASHYQQQLGELGKNFVPIVDMLSHKSMYLRSGYTEQDLRDLYILQ